jgi:hypothetical protein
MLQEERQGSPVPPNSKETTTAGPQILQLYPYVGQPDIFASATAASFSFEFPQRVSDIRYPLIEAQTSNSSATATFSCEFPLRVSETIVDQEAKLIACKQGLPEADCYFEAGYDILPPGCWLVFKEQEALIQSPFRYHFFG